MSTNIDSVKRKLLIKYPTFGSTIANLEFQESLEIPTAGTDGKIVWYNPNFVNDLSEKQQIFLFAHEVCHVAFEHIFRSEGKDKDIWNVATDSVINALLQQDGLPMIDGCIDIPEAVNHDAEEMYNKLFHKKQNQQDRRQGSQGPGNKNQQREEGGQGQGNKQDNREQHNGRIQTQQNEQKSKKQQGKKDVGHDSHGLWEKAIEERKKEQQNQKKEQQNQKKEQQNQKKRTR